MEYNNCMRCKGELVVIQTGNEPIKTRYCKECGLIENAFTKKALEELGKNVMRVNEDGKLQKDEDNK